MKLTLSTVVASLLTGVLARSSVYVVSNNPQKLTTTPEISMNAFSMFYSHMMGFSSKHPVLQLQKEDTVQHITASLFQSDDMFEQKWNANLVVVVEGVHNPKDILSEHNSSFYVNHDNADDYAAVIEEAVSTDDNTLTTYKNQKGTVRRGDHLSDVPFDGEASVKNFKYDFSEFNTDLFSIDNQVNKNFMVEIENIKELSQTEKPKDSVVTVIQVSTLQKIGQEYGVESDEYKEAQLIVRNLFEKLVIPNFQQLHSNGVSTIILTPYKTQKHKRAVTEVGTKGETCFTTAKACKHGTSNCSGNGQCILVDESCYACQCKSSSFVGASCQYVNAVNDFQLLFWTSALLIVITTSVVVCVYQSGSNAESGIILTQSVPKTE